MAGVLASRGSSLSGSTPATSISQADRSQFEKTGSVAIRGNVDPREINQRLSRPGISAAEIARPKMDAAGEPADGTHSAPPLHAPLLAAPKCTLPQRVAVLFRPPHRTLVPISLLARQTEHAADMKALDDIVQRMNESSASIRQVRMSVEAKLNTKEINAGMAKMEKKKVSERGVALGLSRKLVH